MLLYLLFSLGLGYLLYLGITLAAHLHFRSLGPSTFLVAPADWTWMVPGGLFGFTAGALPVSLLFRRLLREEYEEYTLYTNLKYRFDSWRAFQLIAAVSTVLCTVYVVVTMDTYVRVTPDEIVVNRVLSLGAAHYGYRDVQAVKIVAQKKAPDGRIINKPYPAVEFRDGSCLSPFDVIWEATPEQERAMLRYVAQRSGKQIQRVRFIEETGS
jgi:hypothetical protein